VPERKKKPVESELVARGFSRGRPEDVESVRERVRRILAFKAFGMSVSDREDLEQEIMGQLWKATRKANFNERGGFFGFVELVSARRCIDWLRGRRNHEPLKTELKDSRIDPLDSALVKERNQLVRRAVSSLEEPCRRLIEMHFGRRQPYRELAHFFGKSEGALRMQMVRCIRRLRRLLTDLEGSESGSPMRLQKNAAR
jgi:RNA polymerase sigma factor (sigma-70 family)